MINPKSLPRADGDAEVPIDLKAGTYNAMVDSIEDGRLSVAAPLFLTQLRGGTMLGVNIANDLFFTKLTDDWSSNTANCYIGVSCPDQFGVNPSSNVANVAIQFPPATLPPCTPAKIDDVIAYLAFSGTMAGSLFNAGTNVISGIAVPTPIDMGTFYVLTSQNSGSAGTGTVRCTYTYDVKDPISNVVLANDLPVLAPRLLMCTMLAATNGIAQWMPNGTARTLFLVQAFETMDEVVCDS